MDIPAAYEEYTKAYETGGCAAAEPAPRPVPARTRK